MNVSPLSGLTVLIIEDEPLIALSLEDVLTDNGAVCIGPIGSIGSALEMIAMHRFDIALVDINLRGERIDPVADRLSATGVPFLFTTGYGEEARPKAHRHRPVIAKPYSDAEIITALLHHRPQTVG
ncbi:response regulator [Azospirillum melinis]|uniref:Response regulator n=1 Tax=Azospirillum melinis TaxID=328839 RepID=A0ABX2KEU9_9PROT|nr:response regulator [Azospirillum melinis]